MVKKLPEIISRAIFAVAFTKLLGPLGVPLGLLVQDFVSKPLIDKFVEKLGEEFGLALKDSTTDLFRPLKGSSETEILPAGDMSIARLLAKIWEQRLDQLIKAWNFDDEEFRKQNVLLKKWRDKFRETQDEKKLLTLYEIFPLRSTTNFGLIEECFETITNKSEAENRLWEILRKPLTDWIQESELEIFRAIEKDVRRHLVSDLQSELVVLLKNNEIFRESFRTSFEFFAVEHLRTQKASLDELRNTADEILHSLKPTVDYTSETLKQLILDYLEKVAAEATKLNNIYPEEFKIREKSEPFFNKITQKVQFVKKENFDRYKLKLREKARLDGNFTERSDKKIYDQRSFESEMMRRQDAVETLETLEWNENARREFRRSVILGDPGLGKSWLINFEAQNCAAAGIEKIKAAPDSPPEIAGVLKDIDIPIQLRIADLAREAEHDKELVLTIAELASFSEKINEERGLLTVYFKEMIASRSRAVLLFDALDEVPEETQRGLTRREIAKKISDFAKEYPGNSILLTSRKVNYEPVNLQNIDEVFPGENDLEIIPFDETQVKNYVSGWFGSESKVTEIFFNLLENQRQTAGLSQNPLMLTFLCRLFYDLQKESAAAERELQNTVSERYFPDTRCQLYERCLNGLLKDWKDDHRRRAISAAELKSKIRKLNRVAYYLFIEGREQFTEEEFQMAFSSNRSLDDLSDDEDEKSQKFLFECKTDGIITETMRGEAPQYRFIHLTFQEYLTASYVASRDDWKEFVMRDRILFNPDWRHCLHLLGGKLDSNAAVGYIDALLERNGTDGEKDIFCRPFMVAMSAAVEAKAKLDESYKVFLYETCIDKFLNNKGFYEPVLQNFGAELVRYILQKLDSTNWTTEFEKIAEILELIQNSTSISVKIAEKYLEIFKKSLEITPAMEGEQLSESRWMQKQPKRPVVCSDDKEEFEIELESYMYKPPPMMVLRKEISKRLGKLKHLDRHAVSTIFELLRDEHGNIKSGYKHVFEGNVYSTTTEEHIRDNLIEAIDKQDGLDRETIEYLMELYAGGTCPELRRIVSKTLGNQKNADEGLTVRFVELLNNVETSPEWSEILAKIMRNQSELSRSTVEWYVRMLEEDKIAPFLRQTIAETLGEQKTLDTKVIEKLFSLYKNVDNEYLRWLFIGTLNKYSRLSFKMVICLIEIVRGDKELQFVKDRIRSVLISYPNLSRKAIDWLAMLLEKAKEEDPSSKVIALVLEFQYKLSPGIILRLTKILKKRNLDESTREVILYAVLKHSELPPEQLSELFGILNDETENLTMRQAIARSIGRQKNLSRELIGKSIDILKNKDADYSIRTGISQSIGDYINLSKVEIKQLIDIARVEPDLTVLTNIYWSIERQSELSRENILWLIEMIKNEGESHAVRGALVNAVGNQSNLPEDIVIMLLELFKQADDENNRGVIKAISRSHLKSLLAKEVITLTRDFTVNGRYNFIVIDELVRLADQFQCAIPVKGEILINAN